MDMKYKRIRSKEQYNEYCNLYEGFMFDKNDNYEDEIDLLELLIKDYDSGMIEWYWNSADMDPVELLESLIAQHELTKAELARQVDVSRQLITEILNYKRNISKKMIAKLSERFKMQPIAFSCEYNLRNNPKAA
jgi:HTH-type transcriptional regulator/antitoxin HigA